MKLSDRDIKAAIESEAISIDPCFPGSIQPASVDLHLGKNFWIYDKNLSVIDPREPVEKRMKKVEITTKVPFRLPARGFALGSVIECVGVDNAHLGTLDGKSSVGRLGTSVHITASTLNPGNKLCMTLELLNETDMDILLFYGMPIAQILFERLSSPCENEYGSISQNTYGETRLPQVSQYHKNFQPGKNQWQQFVAKLEQGK